MMWVKMDKEKFFIQQFRNNRIGDDAAGVGDHFYSKDAFFEGTHFKRTWMPPYRIAQKAMLVNLSDAIAMAAHPRYALLAVALPKDISMHEMRELARGFEETAAAYGCEIIGGDTIKGDKLHISITIISQSDAPLTRYGLKEGDMLAFTGCLGESAKGLKKLLRGGSLRASSRFIKPTLRSGFIFRSRKYLRCGMDISDGLYSDLDKLLQANAKGFSWSRFIPPRIGLSGEEYEMLVAFDPKNRAALEQTAQKTRTPLTIFGTITKEKPRLHYRSHHF